MIISQLISTVRVITSHNSYLHRHWSPCSMLSVSGARCDVAPWALCKRVYTMYSSGCQWISTVSGNKAFLGQCLRCCPCCSKFFPRQVWDSVGRFGDTFAFKARCMRNNLQIDNFIRETSWSIVKHVSWNIFFPWKQLIRMHWIDLNWKYLNILNAWSQICPLHLLASFSADASLMLALGALATKYDLRDAWGMRCFLRDFVAWQVALLSTLEISRVSLRSNSFYSLILSTHCFDMVFLQ